MLRITTFNWNRVAGEKISEACTAGDVGCGQRLSALVGRQHEAGDYKK